MENHLDDFAKELRDSGSIVIEFTLKIKALQILREFDQFNGEFFATDVWLRGFLKRKD